MTPSLRGLSLFALVAALIVGTGALQSWNAALLILNMGLVSALMSMGLNLQWGYGGLLNVGVMGFVALGGLAVVITSMPPVGAAWASSCSRIGPSPITVSLTRPSSSKGCSASISMSGPL